MKKLLQIIEKLRSNSLVKKLLIVISIIIPLCIILSTSLSGVSLWFDPARDLLKAWDNLSKITLIGPPSGIPGIFYGPYWIWLLSLGLLISKDPVIVTFITATLPYFIIFPFIWFKLSKYFGLYPVIIGWFIFTLSFIPIYSTHLWNPYPAPILVLTVIYLLIRFEYKKLSLSSISILATIGFLLGLVINFHLSFGIVLSLGIIIFLITEIIKTFFIKEKNNLRLLQIKIIGLFTVVAGIIIAFIPTIVFEFRHGFKQLQALTYTFTKYGNVVKTEGIPVSEIPNALMAVLGNLLHLTTPQAKLVFITIIIYFFIELKRKNIKLLEVDKKILFVIGSIIAATCIIFLSAKNPIWHYHFTGIEIIFLIIITFFISKLPRLKIIILIWLIYLITTSAYQLINTPREESYFSHQKNVVTFIKNDAKNIEYTVFSYSYAIYNYEYTYLFRWLANKDIPVDPARKPSGPLIYLIVPSKQTPEMEDFVSNHTRVYKHLNTWKMPGGITVIKQEKIKSSK